MVCVLVIVKSHSVGISYILTGSAVNYEDYTTLGQKSDKGYPGSIITSAGQTSNNIEIDPIDDLDFEEYEAMLVSLKLRRLFHWDPKLGQ